MRNTQEFAAGAGRDLDEQLFVELINKARAKAEPDLGEREPEWM